VSATERVNCSHGCNAELSADADLGIVLRFADDGGSTLAVRNYYSKGIDFTRAAMTRDGNIVITPPIPPDPFYSGIIITDGVFDFPPSQFYLVLRFDFNEGTVVDVNIIDSGFFEPEDVPGGPGEDN